MTVANKFPEQSFQHKERKKAYLKACKWLARYVVDKGNIDSTQTTYNIHKLDSGTKRTTFVVTLYCTLDSTDTQKRFCEACKKFHRSFFVNQEYNCGTCKQKAYVGQLEQRLNIKQAYRKERLDYLLENR